MAAEVLVQGAASDLINVRVTQPMSAALRLLRV
jgi:hypothetical protein